MNGILPSRSTNTAMPPWPGAVPAQVHVDDGGVEVGHFRFDQGIPQCCHNQYLQAHVEQHLLDEHRHDGVVLDQQHTGLVCPRRARALRACWVSVFHVHDSRSPFTARSKSSTPKGLGSNSIAWLLPVRSNVEFSA